MKKVQSNQQVHKPWKKALCVVLSVIIAFGTFVTFTVGSSRLQDRLGIQSMLSAYAKEFVDTKGAVAVNEEVMLADNNLIDLENRDGSDTVYLFSEPVTFVDENGNIKAKDISVEKQSDRELEDKGYAYTNGQNDYRIHFAEDADQGILVEFDGGSYSIAPQSKYEIKGTKSISEDLNTKFEVFEYNNIYGYGTNLKFYPQLNGLKDEIVLNQNIGQNAFSFELTADGCTAKLNDDGSVSLVNDKGQTVQTFFAPFAYDSAYVEGDLNAHYIDCAYSLEEKDRNTYLLTVTVDKNWLESESTVYPVTIDPTTSNISAVKDAGVYRKNPNKNYGNEPLCCFGYSSEYEKGRVYTQFTLPSAIKKGAVINSAYQWEREATGRTTSTKVIAYLVKDSWSETGLVWSDLPSYNKNFASNKRTINSKSTDKENSPYWYKFNIKSIVNEWINGSSPNRGILFRSDEEDELNYNWRAFASRTHSTSSYRPYTVINYTNDATAPTATSVTGNPTSWTKNNVTLTVNGAKDNSGGVGLHSSPYSFSTEKEKYNWQSDKTEIITANGTYYVYVRDVYNNKRLIDTVKVTKIDQAKPTTPIVEGNPTEWTSGEVTLTASSTDSLSGVASYSFSNEKGVYSWQTENSKTFSENTTVYVYAKDKAGKISDSKTVSITKIDNIAPTAPVVTGNPETWTKEDVTLTASSADSGSGVKEYSFSTVKDVYNWSASKTETFDRNCTVYVCARDYVGKNSPVTAVVIDKIDKTPPAVTPVQGNPSTWTNKDVTLSVNNYEDDLSGLSSEAYSFSTTEGDYNWQSENFKTVASNGTYYVYVRDAADNITLLDTVKVDKIERSAPVINNVDLTDNDNITTVTITASDEESGIAGYSIDNGDTWQESNVFAFDKGSRNYVAVKVKDAAGNISSKYYDYCTPEIYYENGKVGLYNPNPDCKCNIYYRFSSDDSSKWIRYNKPFYAEDHDSVYVSFYTYDLTQDSVSKPIKKDSINHFSYSESVTDLSLVYNGVSFNLDRQYKNNNWKYSVKSNLSFENKALIKAELPDFGSLFFVKQNKYQYLNESGEYKLTVVYDQNDENIVEYIINYNDIDYHYDTDGNLSEIGNRFGDCFSFTHTEDSIVIKDGAGRQTVVSFTNNRISSIQDANGGIIRYTYEGNNLSKVTDQAGVIIGTYEYSDGLLSKSGRKSILYDAEQRIASVKQDNGYYTNYEYSDNSITISTCDGKTNIIEYNNLGQIVSYTDENGNVKTYEYDGNNVTEIRENNRIVGKYAYYNENRLYYSEENGIRSEYEYYEEENFVLVYRTKGSEILENPYSMYFYDDYDRLVLEVTGEYNLLDYACDWKASDIDISNGDFASAKRYVYDHSGQILSCTEYNQHIEGMEWVKTLTESSYTYDSYGNIGKTITKVTQNDETSLTTSESTYDAMNHLVYSKSEDGEVTYTYDAAGRVLLSDSDGTYYRTVYDEYGRTVQEIDNSRYDAAKDNLPGAYTDTTVGTRYEYNAAGDLSKEINSNDLETDYYYSSIGLLYKKSFDIYDYYYQNDGKCDRIDVNGVTIEDYDYRVSDSDLQTEEGQYVNRITYANGYVEEQKVDSNDNVYSKYADGDLYYSITASSETGYTYYDYESGHRNIITSTDSDFSYKQQTSLLGELFEYHSSEKDDIQTITEKHFEQSGYQTEISKDKTVFTTPDTQFSYSAVSCEDDSSDINISNSYGTVLSSNISYDENRNTISKSYNENLAFTAHYNDAGTIDSDEANSYSYNAAGELASVTGKINSSYTYDERGNILSRTVDGKTINYSYADNWKDQLSSVDNNPLVYDANGNLTSYDGKTYQWSHGRWLNSVKDGDTSASYTYDSNGIRTSKTVNGETTNYDVLNGLVLAQYDKTHKMYFQYSNESLVGFVLDGTQYFYLTNLKGDIVGIADETGNIIAQYTYDEWGKLLSVSADSEENKALAELNPFRYRGYYYDNETGMYYLNSRYYNPELCRFISADGFSYISNNEKLSLNAYLYCWSNPVTFEDKEGTTPQLSLNIADIILYLKNLNAKIKESAESKIQALKDKCEGIRRNIERTLKLHYNAFIDKLEFAINNPDVVINTALSKLLNKEVNIRFRLLEFIREKTDLYISLSKLKAPVDEIANEQDSGIAPCYIINDDEKSDNPLEVALKVLVISIPIDVITDLFEGLVQVINSSFNYNEWFKDLSLSDRNYIEELLLASVTILNTIFSSLSEEVLSEITDAFNDWSRDELIEAVFDKSAKEIFSLLDTLNVFNSIEENFSEGNSLDYSIIATILDIGVLILCCIRPKFAIGYEIIKELVKKSLWNFDHGKLWG